jgi:hypothetical protein
MIFTPFPSQANLTTVLGILMKHHPEEFKKNAFQDYVLAMDTLFEKKDDDSRVLGLFFATELFQHMARESMALWNKLLPILANDLAWTRTPEIVGTAAYCFSLIAKEKEFGDAKFVSDELFQNITEGIMCYMQSMMQVKMSKKKSASSKQQQRERACDNVLSAFAQILRHHAFGGVAGTNKISHEMSEGYYGGWLKSLPCSRDMDESHVVRERFGLRNLESHVVRNFVLSELD